MTPLLVEALHARLIWLLLAAVAVNPEGGFGGAGGGPLHARNVASCITQGPAPDSAVVAR